MNVRLPFCCLPQVGSVHLEVRYGMQEYPRKSDPRALLNDLGVFMVEGEWHWHWQEGLHPDRRRYIPRTETPPEDPEPLSERALSATSSKDEGLKIGLPSGDWNGAAVGGMGGNLFKILSSDACCSFSMLLITCWDSILLMPKALLSTQTSSIRRIACDILALVHSQLIARARDDFFLSATSLLC